MKRLISIHLSCLSVALLILILWHCSGIGCLWFRFFRFPCPTCGMTRAILSLFKLDFAGYVRYHVLALPVSLSMLLLIHEKLFYRKQWGRVAVWTSFGVLSANLIYYIYKIL